VPINKHYLPHVQVDDLQTHCEDAIASMLDDGTAMKAAFELGANHFSGERLLHMCTSHMMQNFAQTIRTGTFKYIYQRHQAQLQSRIVQEMRDRLAAICTLNGGVAFELPNVAIFNGQ
jgi:hypothetical protein